VPTINQCRNCPLALGVALAGRAFPPGACKVRLPFYSVSPIQRVAVPHDPGGRISGGNKPPNVYRRHMQAR